MQSPPTLLELCCVKYPRVIPWQLREQHLVREILHRVLCREDQVELLSEVKIYSYDGMLRMHEFYSAGKMTLEIHYCGTRRTTCYIYVRENLYITVSFWENTLQCLRLHIKGSAAHGVYF
jgi:hypothetical protein